MSCSVRSLNLHLLFSGRKKCGRISSVLHDSSPANGAGSNINGAELAADTSWPPPRRGVNYGRVYALRCWNIITIHGTEMSSFRRWDSLLPISLARDFFLGENSVTLGFKVKYLFQVLTINVLFFKLIVHLTSRNITAEIYSMKNFS